MRATTLCLLMFVMAQPAPAADDYASLEKEAFAAARQRKFDEVITAATKALAIKPDSAPLYQLRGVAHFNVGKFKESVADFDRYIKANPDVEPEHWQRGISHYYAGMYKEGVKQFEVHRTVNPEDVENAIWHYLCNVKVVGVDKAREALIPIKSDGRKWAPAVYEMYRGKKTPDEVLAASKAGEQEESELKNNLFYAHLYIGLYHESLGKADEAKKHIDIAVKDYPSKHYMGDVARIHATTFKK